jgi:hypothetical protein
VKKILAIIFLLLFGLQLGIKSMVAGYFNLYAHEKALENCEYKNMTVCQGNCYVVKQIKVYSSETPAKKQGNHFDLSILQDIVGSTENMEIMEGNHQLAYSLEIHSYTNLYSFEFYSDLVKPPAA